MVSHLHGRGPGIVAVVLPDIGQEPEVDPPREEPFTVNGRYFEADACLGQPDAIDLREDLAKFLPGPARSSDVNRKGETIVWKFRGVRPPLHPGIWTAPPDDPGRDNHHRRRGQASLQETSFPFRASIYHVMNVGASAIPSEVEFRVEFLMEIG